MTIILAGATGNLGGRIAAAARARGAAVRALVRPGAAADAVAGLRALGVEIADANLHSAEQLARLCRGGSVVVSALSGLRPVILGAQTALLDAAIAAGVPRFIPSDFSIDFTRLPPGSNRNLDLRRDFQRRLDGTRIAATTIFNGAFAELLTGKAPLVLPRWQRVLYWGSADQAMDFTTMDDVAAFTAAAALDDTSPRFLRIAGDQVTARALAAAATAATGTRYKLLRAGGLGRLAMLIKIARFVAPQRDEIYPPWQGMQYLHGMFSGAGKLEDLANTRYPELTWRPVREVLATLRR